MFKKTLVYSLFVSAVLPFPTVAAPLTATEILQQFNLVVLQDAKSQSHVDGRTYVGGSVTGGDYAQHGNNLPASSYAGLTAGGSVTNVNVNGKGAVVGGDLSNANINSGSAVVHGKATNVNFNGAAIVNGGAANVNFNSAAIVQDGAKNVNFNGKNEVSGATQNVNFNGQKVTGLASSPIMQTALTNDAAAGSTNFGQAMDALSQQLSQFTSTGSTVSISGNKATFNAVADANGLAVFDLTLIDTQLFSLGEFQFNLGMASTILFNTDNSNYNFSTNFLGGSAALLGSKAIWNFYNAENITIHNQFGGVILAPDAALNNHQNIEGTVIVESLNQHGEIHQQNFGGTLPQLPSPPVNEVPEPSALFLVALALVLMGWRLRSRKSAK
jgi:choice-of-anchor A domain-containing protein